jgi:tryptophan synthase alpha chain
VSVARIERCFADLAAAGKTALVVYLTIGDPSVEDSIACARAALDAGADILELGVPFSDPAADGPVIAAAAHRAIARGGSLRAALRVAETLRQGSDAPFIVFTYVNPIIAFGEARLPAEAARAGADGFLVVDLPPEEGAELRAAAAREELAVIPLVAPTTDREREARVLAGARGFVYYVSLTGVTGSVAAPLREAGAAATALGERSGLPVVVGFGVDSAEKARALAEARVRGIAVGTAVVRAIAGGADRAARVAAVRELVGALRAGLDAAR